LLSDMHVETKPRKWEQKQVQIKTMEGEFSVTMWASGASDGKSRKFASIFHLPADTLLTALFTGYIRRQLIYLSQGR
jgi:hypothetical protein